MAITDKDIEKLSKVFATKEDLKGYATKNDLLNSQDRIIKKIEDLTTEMKISYGQYRRHEDKLENHETRIQTLESKVINV